MHRAARWLCLAIALVPACLPPAAPDRWTYEVDVSDRTEIIEFEVIALGEDTVWRVAGSASDRISRFGRIDADGLEVWTRDVDDDAALTGLAAIDERSMVGLIHDRTTGSLVLRGFDADGEETWSSPWDEDAWGRPDEFAADRGSIYVGIADTVIACSTEGEDCREHFVAPAGAVVSELLPFGDDRLVVEMIELDRIVTTALDADARVLASHESIGDFVWGTAAAQDVVYIRHGNDALTRLDLTNGDAHTFAEPFGVLGIGATKDGDLLAVEIGTWDAIEMWDEDQLSRYSPDLELRWREPIPLGPDYVREREDGTILVWTGEYQFPDLWITAIAPHEE